MLMVMYDGETLTLEYNRGSHAYAGRSWSWIGEDGRGIEVGGRTPGEAIIALDAAGGPSIDWPADQEERREAAVRHALAARALRARRAAAEKYAAEARRDNAQTRKD